MFNQDEYDAINANVVRNKAIQKATGLSPVQEKYKEINTPGYISPLFSPMQQGWKYLWRIVLTQEIVEDYRYDIKLPIPRYYQLAHRDFNSATFHYYPFGISQLVAIGYWAWYHSYNLIRNLRNWKWKERRIKKDLEAEYKRGYDEGRDFEFRTANLNFQAMVDFEIERRLKLAVELNRKNAL